MTASMTELSSWILQKVCHCLHDFVRNRLIQYSAASDLASTRALKIKIARHLAGQSVTDRLISRDFGLKPPGSAKRLPAR
jgi:hypothetical protein